MSEIDSGNRLQTSQLRFAKLFVEEYAEEDPTFLFADNAWWFWTGLRWKRDTAQRTTAAIVDLFYETGKRVGEDPQAQQDLNKVGTAAGIQAILRLAAGHPGMRLEDITLFDVDPWLLNLQNGTLDLRTLTLHTHDPGDRLTKVAGGSLGSFQDDAPTFARFLEEILPDADTRAYVQRILGSALLGEVKSHALPLFVGRGANGKSTLIEAVVTALGDYASVQDVSLLLSTSRSKEYDRAELRGVRFAPTQEPGGKSSFDTGLIKSLTGGDKIQGRHIYGRPFTFKPSHTIIMATNREPDIEGGDDEALWRRITVVPFSVNVPTEDQDPDLPMKLAAEVDGILGWLVDGFRGYARGGYRLNPPAAVSIRTQEYREAQDPLGQFMDQFCVFGDDLRVTASEFSAKYNLWIMDAGGGRVDPRQLGKEMIGKGFESTKSNGTRLYKGLKIK